MLLAVGGVVAQGGPARQSPPPANFAAYDSYLKGRYLWNKRTPAAFAQAVFYFKQATEQDPKYALAYAGMADCYALDNGYSLRLAIQSMPKAREAAQWALALDPDLAEVHTSLAVIAQNYDYDWKNGGGGVSSSDRIEPYDTSSTFNRVIFTENLGSGFESDNQAVGLNVPVVGTSISSTAPEPSSLALFGIALLALAGFALHRR